MATIHSIKYRRELNRWYHLVQLMRDNVNKNLRSEWLKDIVDSDEGALVIEDTCDRARTQYFEFLREGR
jgi:hypothetical protein